MRRLFLLVGFLFIASLSSVTLAQSLDTIKIMSYNLLNYRNNSISGCSNTNNNPQTKDSDLQTIIDYSLPEILVCNEIGTSDPAASFRVLSNALNKSGRTYYDFTTMQKGQRQNINGSSTGNMIYWDSRVLGLYNSQYLEFDPFNRALVRVIDLFTLYYKDPNLAVHTDTIFIHIFIAHLKAGNTTADRNERDWATDAVMAYLDSNNASGNYLIAGDFNVYRANEPAFQNLVNYPRTALRFIDPALPNNPNFNWSSNPAFASVHTQSTRTAGGCGAGGGMDDRFDFILHSDEILNGTDSLQIIANTYEALGQDGQRYNGTLTGPPANNSAPNNVLQAMQRLSDHLPVVMEMEVRLPGTTQLQKVKKDLEFTFNNPIVDQLTIRGLKGIDNHRIQIMDMSGRILKDLALENSVEQTIDCSDLKGGIYFMKVIGNHSGKAVHKLIKI